MRPLWLDYQAPPPGGRRVGLALLAAGVIATLLALGGDFMLSRKVETTEADVAALKRTAAPTRAAAAPATPAGASAPAHPAAQWDGLFATLEGAASESVTLLGLHPGATEIQITGEAKDFPSAVDYVERLAAAGLRGARLTQSEIVLEHPRHPVRFTLVAPWPTA